MKHKKKEKTLLMVNFKKSNPRDGTYGYNLSLVFLDIELEKS